MWCLSVSTRLRWGGCRSVCTLVSVCYVRFCVHVILRVCIYLCVCISEAMCVCLPVRVCFRIVYMTVCWKFEGQHDFESVYVSVRLPS